MTIGAKRNFGRAIGGAIEAVRDALDRSEAYRAVVDATSDLPVRGVRPDMTNWRAVGIGFLVQFLLGLVAFALPGIGHLVAGLFGGFVAGYLAGGGLGRGFWHGLLAGSLGGIAVAIVLAIAVSVFGLALGPLGPLLGAGVLVVAVFVALLLGFESAIAGAIGAAVA